MTNQKSESHKSRRTFGAHLTPIELFQTFILPEIREHLYEYCWVDLFAGEGNLILPILSVIPENERRRFFRDHMLLFDIQEAMVAKAIEHAETYGIPQELAKKNIIRYDTLQSYPKILFKSKFPLYHITNPPYLYIGYIVKHKETQHYLEYFKGENEGYQDLYQLALMNDLRYGLKKMIYIIPSNFLFGHSVSNKIRDDFLKYYGIKKCYIFERNVFEHTGVNVVLCFFERKPHPKVEPVTFEGIKFFENSQFKKRYILHPKTHYRAGNDFEEFLSDFKASKPLKVTYYLTIDEVNKNLGEYVLKVIDANHFSGKGYNIREIHVNKKLYEHVKNNILFVRTVDTGSRDGRAGLYLIKEVFNVDGILVSKAPYRTHPIQIFFSPRISPEDQLILKEYFNLILEFYRQKTDSEFMTTYKYSKSEYTRKYLGLTQTKRLIETFPLLQITPTQKQLLHELLEKKDIEQLFSFLKQIRSNKTLPQWFS